MKVLIAGAFAVATLAASGTALADTASKYFVTIDTVGNCSVSNGRPSAGQKALGNAEGYDTADAAGLELEKLRGDCKGVVSGVE